MEHRKPQDRAQERLAQESPCPIEVMDCALYFIHNVIDVNIDMLELMIEIRKKKVEQESEALRFLHRCIRRCETLRLEFDGNRGRFCAIERSGVVPGELFDRFNGRVTERVFKKFLYYSLNSKMLQFTTGNLLELHQISRQLAEGQQREAHNFSYFVSIVLFVLTENRSLIDLLLDLIVDENYVSSLDEFFMLQGIRRVQRGERQVFEIFGSASNQPHESVSDEEFYSPFLQVKGPKKNEPQRREGQFLKEDFKKQLESMMRQYQDARVREDFLAVLSRSIRKEFELIQSNPEQQQIYSRFHRKKGKSSLKWMEQRRNSKVAELSSHNRQDILKRAKTNDEFFVSTHVRTAGSAHLQPADAPACAHPEKDKEQPFQLLEELEKWKPQTADNERAKEKKRRTSDRLQLKLMSYASHISTRPTTHVSKHHRGQERTQFRQYFEELLGDDSDIPTSGKKDNTLICVPRNVNKLVEQFEADMSETVETLARNSKNGLRFPIEANEHSNIGIVLQHLNKRQIKSANAIRAPFQPQPSHKFGAAAVDMEILRFRKITESRQTCTGHELFLVENGHKSGFQERAARPKGKKRHLKPRSCKQLAPTQRRWMDLYHTSSRRLISVTIK